MNNVQLIEQILDAIEARHNGFNLSLTRLIDGVHTYSLDLKDGSPILEFNDNEEAYEYLHEHRERLVADAIQKIIEEEFSSIWIVMDGNFKTRLCTSSRLEAYNFIDANPESKLAWVEQWLNGSQTTPNVYSTEAFKETVKW